MPTCTSCLMPRTLDLFFFFKGSGPPRILLFSPTRRFSVLARGGPLLDLAWGRGRMALRRAAFGYRVTGGNFPPEMIAGARHKAAKQGFSIEWVVADAR